MHVICGWLSAEALMDDQDRTAHPLPFDMWSQSEKHVEGHQEAEDRISTLLRAKLQRAKEGVEKAIAKFPRSTFLTFLMQNAGFRCTIPASLLRNFIGKGGGRIRKLQDDFKCRLSISEDTGF